MIHDVGKQQGLEHIPWLIFLAGDGNEVRAKEHGGHAFDAEQRLCQRGLPGIFSAGVEGGAAGHHGNAGDELHGERVGRKFGLYKHGKFLAAPCAHIG